MIKLDPTDPNYISVRSLFKGRPLSQSKILGIFELRMPTKLEKLHEAYKRKLSKQTGQTIENITYRMFHGTTSNFNCYPQRFIDGGEETRFCEKDCGLCGIVQHGNKTKYTRTKSLFKRNSKRCLIYLFIFFLQEYYLFFFKKQLISFNCNTQECGLRMNRVRHSIIVTDIIKTNAVTSNLCSWLMS